MAVEDFANGANILQQVDVSQIFKSLAMGIAEAQRELDDNSIAQLEELSETELAGKSLLELGFVPAFYSFTYADISASIHLRMAEKTSFELGVKANFDYASSTGGESDFSNLSKEHQFFSEKEEFKSNRKFSMKSSSMSSIKVNNQYYSLDQSKGVVSKIDKFHTELLQNEKVDRLNIQRSNAYTTVYPTKTNADFTLLKITNFSGNDVDINSVTIDVTNNFSDTFDNFGSATLGFSGDLVYGLSTSPMPLELFFDFDKADVNFPYDETVPVPSVGNRAAIFDALAAILRLDPSLTVQVDGYTDGSGEVQYNKNLSLNRCNAVIELMRGKGAALSQFGPVNANGESSASSQSPTPGDRKVKITLPANKSYIFFNSQLVGPTPATSSSQNYFIIPPATSTFIIINGDAEGFNPSATSLNAYASTNALFHSEIREDILYLLHESTEFTYMAYSANSENIEIVAEEGSESDIRVYNNENEKERITSLATKNRSDRTFAAGASVDFRFSRQFEMSVEGSASMSARMVAVPPPEAFTLHIATAFNPPPTP